MSDFDVIIIGAGVSGLMAAITAAKRNRNVLLIEKMEQPGRKLRITGKGRCNLTNANCLDNFLAHAGRSKEFLRDIFSAFSPEDLMTFFEKRSVKLVVERGNRVFPASNKAQDIFFALIKQVEMLSVKVMKNATVNHILIENNKVVGVELKNKTRIFSKKVILATGGKSYPLTGSTGDGYRMAKELGHTVTTLLPALVPLICKESIPVELENFPLKNIRLSVFFNDQKIWEEFGEMSFTKNGITGPLVLTLSRQITNQLHKKNIFTCFIDFKPALSEEKLEAKLERECREHGQRSFKDALRLWLPAKLQRLALQNIPISEQKMVCRLSVEERKKICKFLKQFPLTITATKSFDEAIITQGGISLEEINSKTMESKLVKGLYFAGEVMDLDADTGGYNLQIAFSTGYIAGNNV